MNQYLLLIWLHFIGDFILQTDNMATNKSKSLKYLYLHCFVYALPFNFIGIKFAIYTGIFHLMIDYFTSKINSWLYINEQRHWFFTCIGLDQAIHLTILFNTLSLI